MILGTIIMIAGLTIRLLSIKSLGSSFSEVIKTPTELKTDGIYKYVRHPCYLGSMLLILGLTLINLKLAIMYVSFVFYYSRIRTEEGILSAYFKKYEDYKKTTGMLIPKLHRKITNSFNE